MSELKNCIKTLERELEKFKNSMEDMEDAITALKKFKNSMENLDIEDEIADLKNGVFKTTTQDELDFTHLWFNNKKFRKSILEKFPELRKRLDEMVKKGTEYRMDKKASIVWDMCKKYSLTLGEEKEREIANFIFNLCEDNK